MIDISPRASSITVLAIRAAGRERGQLRAFPSLQRRAWHISDALQPGGECTLAAVVP